MTATEYCVKGETHEGKVLMLRRGFESHEAAEDHPVTLSYWKRVWVEPVEPKPVDTGELPPKPWDWVTSGEPSRNGQFHAYLVDANGKKIGAIWGGKAKALIADHIIMRCNAEPAAS